MKKIITIATILISTLTLTLSTSAFAKLKVDTLVDTTTSWDGGSFAYGKGNAKIVVKKIVTDTDKGFKAFHCHITPLVAYVVKGQLEVVKKSGATRVFKAGEVVVEVMNQWHAGKFSKGTELIVFYANSEKYPLNVYAKDSQAHLCK
jgi:quercetin dioxygenase-like cupin family protein